MNTANLKTNNPIDELGAVLAQKKDLEQREGELKTIVKDMGVGQHEGQLFMATVSDVDDSESYDAAKMEAKLRELGVDNRFFNKIVKVKPGYRRVLVKSR